jgi:hypothetical protein
MTGLSTAWFSTSYETQKKDRKPKQILQTDGYEQRLCWDFYKWKYIYNREGWSLMNESL